MELLLLILLLIVIGFSTFRLRRVLQQRRQAQVLTTAAAGQATIAPLAYTNRLDSWLDGAIAKLQGKPVEDQLVPRFRAWVETALDHEAKLQAWLLALSPEQLQALVTYVAAYCEQLRVNLTWLTEQQSDVPPALKSTAQEIVIDYCLGIWKATQIKAKLDLFTEYQQLTQPALQPQQQIFQRELLAHLAAQKMVAIEPLAATLTGSEAERQAKVVAAIQQAATKDWEHFAIIFQTAVSQHGIYPEK